MSNGKTELNLRPQHAFEKLPASYFSIERPFILLPFFVILTSTLATSSLGFVPRLFIRDGSKNAPEKNSVRTAVNGMGAEEFLRPLGQPLQVILVAGARKASSAQ